MKTIAAIVLLVAFAYAEPPPSNSYLPPPLSSHGAGYQQGPANQNFGPQIVAARTLDGPHAGQGTYGGKSGHGSQVNGFGRSGLQKHGTGAHARFGGEEPAGYDHNAAALARNALEDINSEPANYNFGYMVNDYQEGTDFGHHEERQEERAQGEYHVVLPDGRKQTVSYEADERGFKPQISYEDSEDLARSSGYDSNANNVHSNHDNGYSSHANHDSGYPSHGDNDKGYSSHSNSDNGYSSHGNSDNGYSSHGNSDKGYTNHGNHGNGNARSNGY